jgi:hypothetical protein
MKHLSEEELVEFYYGEDLSPQRTQRAQRFGNGDAAREHLAACRGIA